MIAINSELYLWVWSICI